MILPVPCGLCLQLCEGLEAFFIGYEMNKQEMFNAAYLGLMKQGKPSRQLSGCYYRLEEGGVFPKTLCCGVGFMIKDEFYDANGETAVYELIPKLGVNQMHEDNQALFKMLADSGVDCSNNQTHDLLCDIQSAHDDVHGEDGVDFKEDITARFVHIATAFGLTMPEVPA